MHDGMPYGPIQGSSIENLQSREVDRQSPMGLIFIIIIKSEGHKSHHLASDIVIVCQDSRKNNPRKEVA